MGKAADINKIIEKLELYKEAWEAELKNPNKKPQVTQEFVKGYINALNLAITVCKDGDFLNALKSK